MNERLILIKEKFLKPKVLIMIGIIGILLVIFSDFMPENKEKPKENNFTISEEEYANSLEEKIKKITENITGAKNAKVIVTLESGIKYIYATKSEENTSENTDKEKENKAEEKSEDYVTYKTENGAESPVLIKTQMPEIRGVAIVCDGGDNEILREKIENAVIAALNITSKRVYICGRKR